MGRASVSACIAGDPVHLAQAPPCLHDLPHAIGADGPGVARAVAIGPGVALIHRVVPAPAEITFRWITLPRASRLVGLDEPLDVVICSSAPITESAAVVRLLEELVGRLGDPDALERTRTATTRSRS